MSFDKSEQLCRKSWEEEYNHLYIDRSKKRDQGRYCICDERKSTSIDCFQATKPFWLRWMLYSIKNRVDLESLNELVLLQNHVKALKIQDKLGKQNFHEDMKKVFETTTKSVKHVSEEIANTITETSIENNKALEISKNKLSEFLNDRGIMAACLLSLLSEITNHILVNSN